MFIPVYRLAPKITTKMFKKEGKKQKCQQKKNNKKYFFDN
jgi:hypothetical protein